MIDPLRLDEIRAAAAVIHSQVPPTPVLRSAELDALVGGVVFCKAEALQRTGSFKFRGAFHRLSKIPPAERAAGVVAVSSGNHGAAIADAARLLGIPATIHIPDDAPAVKRKLIDDAGAAVVTFDRATVDREGPARCQAAETGATFVHPFEDRDVMLGQATTALELFDEIGPVDTLVVPMSGGGLMAGCASAMNALAPQCTLVGVEPSEADDTRRSFEAGRPVRIAQPTTIADGLAVTSPGAHTFEINHRLVDEVVTVREHEIANAMEVIVDTLGLLVEPSGAVGIAALLARPGRWGAAHDARIGVILSGGNVDLTRWGHLLGRR